jgi:hypothetical protein
MDLDGFKLVNDSLSRLNEYSPHPGHQPCRSGFSRERRQKPAKNVGR